MLLFSFSNNLGFIQTNAFFISNAAVKPQTFGKDADPVLVCGQTVMETYVNNNTDANV